MPLTLAVRQHLLNDVTVFIPEFSRNIIDIHLLRATEVALTNQVCLPLTICTSGARVAAPGTCRRAPMSHSIHTPGLARDDPGTSPRREGV